MPGDSRYMAAAISGRKGRVTTSPTVPATTSINLLMTRTEWLTSVPYNESEIDEARKGAP
jgi:hypothetical protein